MSTRSKMQQEKNQSEKRRYLDPKKHDEFKKKKGTTDKRISAKKKLAEQVACDSHKETEKERPSTSSSFSSKQILNRSIKKAERSLPFSPRRKAEVTGSLAKKFKLRIAVAKNKTGRKKNKLNQEEREWLENFLERADITYTTPGRRDTVYVGMDHGKRQYKQKRYLVRKICDLLGIINASKVITNEQYASFPETFQRDLSFRQVYELFKGALGAGLEWSNTTIFLLMRTLRKRSTFSKRYQFEFKIKDFGNQCTWLSRGKCLRFKSRCLHGRRVWTLLDIKFIVIRFGWRKKKEYHFWIGNR